VTAEVRQFIVNPFVGRAARASSAPPVRILK